MDDYLINKITVIVVSKTVIQIINFIKKCNENLMNMKRIFGGLLTLQGIGGLIYSSVLLASNTSGTGNIKVVIVYV